MKKEVLCQNFHAFVKQSSVVDLTTRNNLFNRMCENQGKPETDKTIYLITGGIATGKSIFAYNLIRFFNLENLPYVSSDTFYYKYFCTNGNFSDNYNCAREYTDKILSHYSKEYYSFIWETVLSKRKKETYLKNCKKNGYKLYVLFIGIDSPEAAYNRANLRKLEGYHEIQLEFIKDRYNKSINSLNWLWEISDMLAVIDNTSLPKLIYYFGSDGIYKCSDIPHWFANFNKDDN